MTGVRRTDRWAAHPALGALLRVAILIVPVVSAVLVAWAVASALPQPEALFEEIGWWAAVLGSSFATVMLVDRLSRRLLPLAVLLELSLVFPDRAPSRLRAARTSSVRDLENRLSRLRSQGVPMQPYEAAETLVVLVGMLGVHDKRTRGHSERVRAFCDLLTAELGLPEEDRVRLRWAALVHDLGKLSVSLSVLNGGRDITEDDWDSLRRHPAEGERLVAGLLPWLGSWGGAVVQHHERWDGTGYPSGTAGEDISYGARIVALADSFEVMTAARSYKAPMSAVDARRELARHAGTQFDPALVRAFLGISIGKLRWVMGPLTWLAQLPFVSAGGDAAGRAVKGTVAAAAVAGLIGLGTLPGPSTTLSATQSPPDPPPVAAAVVPPAAVVPGGAPPALGSPPDETAPSVEAPSVEAPAPDAPAPAPPAVRASPAAPAAPAAPVAPAAPAAPAAPVAPAAPAAPAAAPAAPAVPAPAPVAPPQAPAPAPPPPAAPAQEPAVVLVPAPEPAPAPEPPPSPAAEPPPSPAPEPPPSPAAEPSPSPAPEPPPSPAPEPPPTASPSPTPTPTPSPTAVPPGPVVLRYFLRPPAELAATVATADALTTFTDEQVFDATVPQAFTFDPTRPPSATLWLDFAGSPGNSSRVGLDLQACTPGCVSVATATVDRAIDGLRAYSATFTVPEATVLAPGDRLQLVLTRSGGPARATVDLGTGPSTPSALDVPGLAAPAA